jgi:Cu2+-exporting ATPase
VAVGNRRLMEREGVDAGGLAGERDRLSSSGRTAVLVAVDGRAVAAIAIADAVRPTSAEAVAELRRLGIGAVMLTGDNRATAERIAAEVGIERVIAEVLPADKAARVAELQGGAKVAMVGDGVNDAPALALADVGIERVIAEVLPADKAARVAELQGGAKVAMVGDGVNDAPALALADVGIAIGAGTDVAIEAADVVLVRSDPLDIPTAITIGRATVRKMRQNLAWAIGYNTLALPVAAGVFVPWFGFGLRPEIAALAMSGSSVIVATNAVLLKRLRLPDLARQP